MAPGGSAAPALRLDILDPGVADGSAWGDWYDGAFLTARAALPGVVVARRCVGIVGSVREMAVFDLADAGVPFSPAWRAADQQIAMRGAADPQLAVHREHVVSYLLRQIATSAADPYLPPGTDILHMAFFIVEPPHQDEFNDWYELEHAPAILEVPGYRNIRRFQGVEDGRVFVALYDVDGLEVAEGPVAAEAMRSRWSDRIRAKLVTYRERRLFRVERQLLGPAATAPSR